MDQLAKEELPDPEAAALHAWIRRFNYRSGGRGIGLEPWYIDGYIPRDATADVRDELAAAVVAVLRELTSSDGFVHFADVEHEYARFYPHRLNTLSFDDVFETRTELLAAINAILDAGGAVGDLRRDVTAEDIAASLIGIFTAAPKPQRESPAEPPDGWTAAY